MNLNTFFVASLLVICAVFHIVLFSLPVEHTDSFWICVAFTMGSFLAQGVLFRFQVPHRQGFLNYTLATLGGLWLALQMAFHLYVAYRPPQTWLTLSVCTGLTGVALLLIFGTFAVAHHSEKVEATFIQQRKNDCHPMSDLVDEEKNEQELSS